MNTIAWPDGTVERLSDEEYILIDPTGSFYDPDELMGSTVRLITNVKRNPYWLPGESPSDLHSWVCRVGKEYAEHNLVQKIALKRRCKIPNAYRIAIDDWIERHVNKAFRDTAKNDLELQFTLYQQEKPPFLTGISKHGTCLALNLDHAITASIFMPNAGTYKTFVNYQYTLWDGQTLSDTSIEKIKSQGGLEWLKLLSTE